MLYHVQYTKQQIPYSSSIVGGMPDRDYMCLYIVCNQCVL